MGKENQLEQTTLMSFGKKLIHILLRDDNNIARRNYSSDTLVATRGKNNFF